MEIDLKKLEEEVGFKLIKADLTIAKKILFLTENELQKIGNFTAQDTREIFHVAADTVLKLSHVQDVGFITTGCSIIDFVLGGGVYASGGITELSGESGCGKTQLCLQLALTAQNPPDLGGLNKNILYICTEDSFPSKRLHQLIHNVKPPFKSNRDLPYGDRIYVEHLADVKSLKICLFNRLPKLLAAEPVGLLIIDSIAALFRSDYSFQEGMQRTKDIRNVGYQLHALSKKYKLCVLCVNQVSSSLNQNTTVPALGLAWANLVTTRILMRKYSHQDGRKIELIFSPHTGPACCNYVITEYGIQGCLS